MALYNNFRQLLERIHTLEEENTQLRNHGVVKHDTHSQTSGVGRFSYLNKAGEIIFVVESIYGVPNRFVEINQSMIDYTGYTKEEIFDFDPLDILAKGEKKKMLNNSEMILNERFLIFNTVLRKKNGGLLHVEMSVRTLDDSYNPQLLIIARNLAIRKFQNALTFQQDALSKLMLEHTNEIVFHLSIKPNLRFDYINQAAQKIFGYDSEELMSNPNEFFSNIHPDDLEQLQKTFEKKAGYTGLVTVRYLRKDDQVIWIDVYLSLRNGLQSNVLYCAGVMHDVTLRVQNERRVDKKLKTFSAINAVYAHLLSLPLNFAFDAVVEEIGRNINADTVLFYNSLGEDKTLFCWYRNGDETPHQNYLIPTDNQSYLGGQIRSGAVVYLKSIEDLPVNNTEDLQFLSRLNIKSALAIPLFYQKQPIGYFALYKKGKEKIWDRVEIHLLNSIAEIVSLFLERHKK